MMGRSFRRLLKSFSYSLMANLTSLVISVLVIFVVPKLIGVTEYSYWQLYLFYTSYVGFFHFGWNDGIYLRYGGQDYEELDKNSFYTQFLIQLVSQLFLAALVIVGSMFLLQDDGAKQTVLLCTAIAMVMVNLRFFFTYILQATNRIKEYSYVTLVDKLVYAGFIVAFLFFQAGFTALVVADLLGKLVSLVLSMGYCRDLLFRRTFQTLGVGKEIRENVVVGCKLMFANIASMLIMGVIRFGIEHTWDIETFGKVSLMISFSNFILIFINAVGVVVYPVLRNISEQLLTVIFRNTNLLMTAATFVVLLVYYPFKSFLAYWLPNYAGSLEYIAVLFPMCIYEGKMSLLYSTYLKALRKEKIILGINVIVVALSGVTTLFTTILFPNLDLAVLSILVLIGLKSILSEAYLAKQLGVPLAKDVVYEVALTVVFVLCSKAGTPLVAVGVYAVAYAAYLLLNFKRMKIALREIGGIIR